MARLRSEEVIGRRLTSVKTDNEKSACRRLSRNKPQICNLYSITTNQAAIIALFRAITHNVANLPPMPGVFPDYPAPIVRNAAEGRELTMDTKKKDVVWF